VAGSSLLATAAVLLSLNAAPAVAQSCPNSADVGFSRVLPDCRAYEQVSPVQKNGNDAGALPQSGSVQYTVASADGDRVLVASTGGLGDTDTGAQLFVLSSRSAAGWSTQGLLPSQNGQPGTTSLDQMTGALPSADLSQLAVGSFPSLGPAPVDALDLFGPGGSASWLSQPTISDPIDGAPPQLAGASADFSRIYFAYAGTLMPADEQPNPAFGGASRRSVISSGASDDIGFYEWTPRGLSYAGVLPDGSADPYGALPAAMDTGTLNSPNSTPIYFNNHEVSSDGSRALFVSPDPDANPPTSDPPELYVRESEPDGSQRTVLVSASAMTGQPAADSPLRVGPPDSACLYPIRQEAGCSTTFAYASPDGSHVFFEDLDALTADAPNDGSVKVYEFDTESNTLTYLPGVDDQQPGQSTCDGAGGICSAPIITSTADGSELLFLKETPAGDSLDLWSDGQIEQVAQFPEGLGGLNDAFAAYSILEGRASTDGSVFVFETSSPIYTGAPGQFNNAGGFEQIYRYVVSTGQLACLSCGPAGLAHTGDASMSNDGTQQLENTDSRGTSSDDGRVFFDTPDALVPQDQNGVRDVYEWEADGDGSCQSAADEGGCLFLISSGQSRDPSFFLDNSANGDDVFFTTTDGLVPQDTDGAYDVYDARVDGGFPASVITACSGDACQGAATPTPVAPTAATVTFSGPGNARSATATPQARVLTHTVRGTTFLVRVRVPERGRIAITGSGIKPVSRSLDRAATFAVRAALTAKSKHLLARRHGLKLTLRVRYTPAGAGPQAANATLTVKPALRRSARRAGTRTHGGAR